MTKITEIGLKRLHARGRGGGLQVFTDMILRFFIVSRVKGVLTKKYVHSREEGSPQKSTKAYKGAGGGV